MKRQSTALLVAAVLGLGAFGCFKDPVSDLQGSPSRVSLSRRFLQPTAGDTTVVNVQVLDQQGNPLMLENVTYTSLDPAVASMEPLPDSVLRNFPGLTLTKANVIATGTGTTKIVVAANGVNDTITVITYPTGFAGTITPTVAEGGNIVITAPTGVTFSTTATAVGNSGPLYRLVSRTATVLTYVAASVGAAQTLTINGAILLGSIPLPALVSNATFTVTAPTEPANDAAATTTATLTPPAAPGDSVVGYGSIDGSDIDDFWNIVVVAGDSIQIRIDWPAPAGTDLDIDGLFFRANGTTLVKCPCTGANPEGTAARIAFTESYKLEVNMYDNHGHSEAWPYRVTVWRR